MEVQWLQESERIPHTHRVVKWKNTLSLERHGEMNCYHIRSSGNMHIGNISNGISLSVLLFLCMSVCVFVCLSVCLYLHLVSWLAKWKNTLSLGRHGEMNCCHILSSGNMLTGNCLKFLCFFAGLFPCLFLVFVYLCICFVAWLFVIAQYSLGAYGDPAAKRHVVPILLID